MNFTKETLKIFEQKLLDKGYIKYKQNYRREDYMYWKGFSKNKNKGKSYSIGFAIYDWSKYPQFKEKENISVSFHFLLGNNHNLDRLDIDIMDDKMTIEEVELFGEEFYKFFKTTKLGKNEKKEN